MLSSIVRAQSRICRGVIDDAATAVTGGSRVAFIFEAMLSESIFTARMRVRKEKGSMEYAFSSV